MKLAELAELGIAPASAVPSWALGCFRRRSITFYTAACDTASDVLWLQSRGLTADLRLPAERARVESLAALADCPFDVLLALAEVEGGLARASFSSESGAMHWHDWTSFQLHAKWPEPGALQRVGDCLVEFAPSGAYVEDWRFQAPGEGPLIGLELVEERELGTGRLLHRGGGLVVCGQHAAFVRGRARALPQAERLGSLIGDQSLLDAIFGFDASYGKLDASGEYVALLSTLPWREGHKLFEQDGFSYLAGENSVLQRVHEAGRDIERRFSIDTLEPKFDGTLATPAEPGAVSWLEREAHALLRSAR